ncbi:PPE family protein [Mycolicibacterium porcinum]|uniref:PPE family protein n=2 Tax=Mycolicibacterium porcinum TaxID=39693 RepID=A0ABV3VNA5_9MYCO
MTGAWGALPPEENSAGFWLGPGASSMMAAAGELEALAGAIIGMLGGHEAVALALGTSWPAPTGELAVLANVPHLLWQARAAGMITTAAGLITATAEAFETLKAATPTPMEIGENQIEHVALNNANFLGLLTSFIIANRARYGQMWVTSASNKYAYAAASEAGVQAIPPLDPPTPSAMPMGGDPGTPFLGSKPEQALTSAGAAPQDAMSTFMPMLSQLGQVSGQAGQLTSGANPLSNVGQLQQGLQPVMSLASQIGQMTPPGADAMGAVGAGSWLSGAPGGGGPVAANLVSGGGGGGFGGGTGAVSTALRGPVSWASPTVNASSPAGADVAVSRLAEARGASPMGGGMGAPGAMMGPMAHAAGDDKREGAAKPDGAKVLSSAASLYRSPTGLPVITGGSGAVFRTGEVADPQAS